MADVRLIDANALTRWLESVLSNANPLDRRARAAFSEVLARVKTMLDIDAAPVVHGRWVYKPPRVMECQDKPVLIYGSDKIVCTACGGKASSPDWLKFAYCPNCGAKMDAKEE